MLFRSFQMKFPSHDRRHYDSLHFFAATRYSWYRSHYLGLLENFFTDACELQLHALDEGAATFTEDSEALVDDFIWKMMDHDLKAADNMECCNNINSRVTCLTRLGSPAA